MIFSFTDYLRMVRYVEEQESTALSGGTIAPFEFDQEPLVFAYEGDLVAKERPRKGKNGKMFTPQRTRNFEKKVAEWGMLNMAGMGPLSFPIKVSLLILDQTNDQDAVLHSQCGLTYNTKSDIDNYEKSILDGLNKVVWRDDKQVCEVVKQRRWALAPGFRIAIYRAGLSEMEYQNFLKVWRNREKYNAQNAD